MALLIAVPGGMLLGILAGLRPDTPLDYLGPGTAIFGLVVPHFVLASLLILLFSTLLGWSPAGGFDTPSGRTT